MFGWTGTTLRVNFSTGKVTRGTTDTQMAKHFIGARGLATKIMSMEVDPRVDPLSPDNKIIFAPGPFTGTYAPSAGRFDVVTKGPLTGTIAASNSGGIFGAELKYAGYDLLILEGKSEKPVYLWISDDQVEIRDAIHLWGSPYQIPLTCFAPKPTRKPRLPALALPGRNCALRLYYERNATGCRTDRCWGGYGLQESQGCCCERERSC